MPRSRPPYPPEFRAEAISLVRSSGEPIPKITGELGVSAQTLRNWIFQAGVDAGESKGKGLKTDERERLRELERENRRLREEREILRKAAAFFATETGRR